MTLRLPKRVLLGAVLAGLMVLVNAPAQALPPVLRCNANGKISYEGFESMGTDGAFMHSYTTGVCTGGPAPQDVILEGFGSYCLQVVSISNGIDPCVGWSMGVNVVLTNQVTGAKRYLTQRWANPLRAAIDVPAIVFNNKGRPVGLASDAVGNQLWCGGSPYHCEYAYSVTLIFRD